DFYRQRLNELGDKRLDINRDIRKSQEDLKKAYENLNRARAAAPEMQSEVFVTVSCSKYVSGELNLRYFTDLAGWKPSYDFRVSEITKPLNVVYHGTVYQSTGEDWNNVQLSLSSANPSISNTAPQLETWYINRGDQKQNNSASAGTGSLAGFVTDAKTSEPLPYASVSVFQNGRLISGDNTSPDGNYRVKPLKTGQYQIQVSYVGYVDQTLTASISDGRETQLNAKLQSHGELMEIASDDVRRDKRFSGNAAKAKTEEIQQQPYVYFDMEVDDSAPKMELSATDIVYEIDERFTVKSNGKDHSTQIKEAKTPATFVYRAVPKLDLDAFLIARLGNWGDLELLTGETRIYYQGAYIGSAELDTDLTVDTLELSLGRDESIKISREKDRKIDDKRIIGNNTKKTVAWDITIRNNKSTPIDMELYDQYPLSEYKSISIDYLGHGDAKHDEKTGELKWKFSIPGSESKVKSFSYSVKYPSSGKFVE
ncbi:MAG: mucoidy inhibitor MuiA family protein, partial [Cryomorphaceae bacterium]